MATSFPKTLVDDDFPFRIVSHLIPVHSFREYQQGIIDETKDVYLAVKQYIPLINQPLNDSDPITIVSAPGVGFPKENYEPLFEQVLRKTSLAGLNIRSIWIADPFNMGESAVANQENLGRDASTVDHSRDLWGMINHFRHLMPKPIVGLAHSMGCSEMLLLSSWHPSLFHSFAFIEPGIDPDYGRTAMAKWISQTLQQGDFWDTREEAEEALVKSQMAHSWTKKTLARLKHYGVYLVKTETGLKWTLTTPKYQIAVVVFRRIPKSVHVSSDDLANLTLAQRELVPDLDPNIALQGRLFYRPELQHSWDLLPKMRPWVLYVNGSSSPHFGDPSTRDLRAQITGTGLGGNGGIKLGAVQQIIMEGAGHDMPFNDNIEQLSVHIVDWFTKESRRWDDGAGRRLREWRAESPGEKHKVTQDYAASLPGEMAARKKPAKL
ncbi:uncharacterized protein N7483_005682 [Penicillium malachiteum]|uniref:uncharacterized protein n=1 Tax=Penicillium malachiteum TaxID=1324776 RepID=UPI002548DFC2|nr:uncharacterized protein N7483_005682 [Penicillium malachiteum]KAJ5731174.1 hypothetical protein N7483_005682 [Penicillium malachiteum]